MSLDTTDKLYIQTTIDVALEKSLQRFKSEAFSHMTALREGLDDKVKFLAELIQDKPGRGEVREIVREEARPIVQEEIHKLVMPHFSEIHKEIAGVRSELKLATMP